MNVRIFGHYISIPLLLLMMVEVILHAGAVYFAGTVRFLDTQFQLHTA